MIVQSGVSPNLSARLLTIRYQPIDGLVPYKRNARTHSKQQIRQIAESIRTFGFTNPILVDAENTIIAGHGRVEAAKQLGMKEVPTIRLDDLSEDQIRAYILADNRLAENAGWDESILAIELQHLLSIDCGDFDVTVTGFEVPEIDLILEQAEAKPDLDDEFEPAVAGPPVTRAGDLWLLGKHRLLCASSLDGMSFTTLLGGKRAEIVFIDPPYNVPIDGHATGNGSIHHQEFAMASGEMTEEQFSSFLSTSLGLLAEHSTDGSTHFVCMDWRHLKEMSMVGANDL